MGAANKYGRPAQCSDYWFGRLWDRAVSFPKWAGLPDTVNLNYLETVVQRAGFAIACRDKDGKVRVLEGAAYGVDPYNYPTTFTVSNVVLGTITGKIGVDGFVIRNNMYAMPSLDIVERYAKQLEQIDNDIQVNLFNVKTNRIFPVENEGQAQQIRRLLDTVVEKAVPAYLVSKSIMQPLDDSKPLVLPTEYLGTELSEGKIMTLNAFYSEFGINGIPLAKRERLTSDEVASNNDQIAVNREFWIRERRRACELFESVLGVKGVTVDWTRDETRPIESEVDGDE